MPKRKIFGIVVSLFLILVVVSISGCVDIEQHIKVSKDGTIKEFKISTNMSKEVYLMLLEDSPSNSLCGKFPEEITCKERVSGNQAIVVLTIENVKPEDLARYTDNAFRIKIYKEGDYLIYEDYSSFGEDSGEFGSLITVDYYLEMPGKIVESNADIVEGNKAEWHMNADQMTRIKIYAKSEISKGIWGPALIILGLTLLLLLFRKKK